MANLNKVMLIGRFTRDPEARSFANGGKVVSFGFACNNRKKNAKSGEWEDEPIFLDCEAFDRQNYQLASRMESMTKGTLLYIEGHLKLDQWADKTSGDKRSKLKIVVDNFQYLEPKRDGARSGGGNQSGGGDYGSEGAHDRGNGGGDGGGYNPPADDQDIPF